jgi:hypothetical protein
MAKIPTVHNPVNFDPANYEVVDYLDNKRPGYYGQGMEAFEAEVKFWEADMLRVFGEDWRKKVRRCVHCGNGRVRWITATKHLPTGNVVVFGSDCTFRLDFANKQEWKLAVLKSKAEAGHARIKVWNARVKFLEANPVFAAAVEQAKNPVHAKNSFVADVISKLNLYGSLSERQVSAVLSSLKRDVDTAAAKAVEATEVKGDAPTGRVMVTGTVLGVKVQESDFGVVKKMLVRLENNSKVWVTVPGGSGIERNDMVTFTATFSVSKDDKSFGFGSRPVLVNRVAAAA